MECIEARAMKSSFYSEIDMKLSQQVFFDDSWCVTGINNFSSDDFSVDDLLDFSDKDFEDGSLEESEEEEEEKDSLSASSQDRTDDENSNSTTFSVPDDFDSFPSSDLPVTVDDLENLEWLSQFVDDSASERSLLCPAGLYKGRIERFPENPSESSKVKSVPVPLFPFPVPSKRRSKRSRARPSGRVWPLGPPSLSLTESSSTWCSSSYITSLNYPCMWTQPVEFVGIATKTPAKKQKKKPEAETRNGCNQSQGQRRCSHCQVHKTPQWRTGPLGAKTLCNACGVRDKSGRLFPEYRPACSPTFSGHIHSNSHRKVLEMRRKKDTEMAGVTLEFGSTPTVSPLSAL